MLISGTIYVEYPGVSKVLVTGRGTESTSLTETLDTVSIEQGALVTIGSDITISNLLAVDSDNGDVCKLTVESGNTLTATAMGE